MMKFVRLDVLTFRIFSEFAHNPSIHRQTPSQYYTPLQNRDAYSLKRGI
jgi:hypothetical protein